MIDFVAEFPEESPATFGFRCSCVHGPDSATGFNSARRHLNETWAFSAIDTGHLQFAKLSSWLLFPLTHV